MQEYHQNRLGDHVELTTTAVLGEALASVGLFDPDPQVIAHALERMYAPTERHWMRVPGLEMTLNLLQRRGLRLGLLSNAGDDANVQRLIDKAGIRSFFDPILVSAAVGERKPSAGPFLQILEHWHLEPDQVVMVGDRLDQDILGAQQVGMHQIWMRGYAEVDHGSEITPELTADSLMQLPTMIDDLSEKG